MVIHSGADDDDDEVGVAVGVAVKQRGGESHVEVKRHRDAAKYADKAK